MLEKYPEIRKHSRRTKLVLGPAVVIVTLSWFFTAAFFCAAAGEGSGPVIYICVALLWLPPLLLSVIAWSIFKVFLNLHSLSPGAVPATEDSSRSWTAKAGSRLMAAPARIRKGYYESLEEPDRRELRVDAVFVGLAFVVWFMMFLKLEVIR